MTLQPREPRLTKSLEALKNDLYLASPSAIQILTLFILCIMYTSKVI